MSCISQCSQLLWVRLHTPWFSQQIGGKWTSISPLQWSHRHGPIPTVILVQNAGYHQTCHFSFQVMSMSMNVNEKIKTLPRHLGALYQSLTPRIIDVMGQTPWQTTPNITRNGFKGKTNSGKSSPNRFLLFLFPYPPTPAKQGAARQGIGGSDSTHQRQIRNNSWTTTSQKLFNSNSSTIDR